MTLDRAKFFAHVRLKLGRLSVALYKLTRSVSLSLKRLAFRQVTFAGSHVR